MKRTLVVLGLVAAITTPAFAQRSWAYEAGLFAQYTKYADTTHLTSGFGAGARFGIFILPRIALEYEASVIPTSTRTQSCQHQRAGATASMPYTICRSASAPPS